LRNRLLKEYLITSYQEILYAKRAFPKDKPSLYKE